MKLMAAVEAKDWEAVQEMNPFHGSNLTPLNADKEEKGCEECEGGWIFLPDRRVKPCKCQELAKAKRNLEKSGLAKAVEEMTFATFVPRESWQQTMKERGIRYVAQILEGKTPWFFIGGQVGSGKTHLCTAICADIMAAGKEVRYMVWPQEGGQIKALAMEPEAREERLAPLTKAQVLYIDDFWKAPQIGGVPNVTQGDMKLAFELINHRYNRGLATMISSQWPMEGLMRVDEATVSRIYQLSEGYRISIGTDGKKNQRMGKKQGEEQKG